MKNLLHAKILAPILRIKNPLVTQKVAYSPSCYSYEKISTASVTFPTVQMKVFDPFSFIFTPSALTFCADFEGGSLGPVYHLKGNTYEIHMLPDKSMKSQWFFFKINNIPPGEYTFLILPFSIGKISPRYRPCYFSENDAKKGIGWQRKGENVSYFRKNKCWVLSFSFYIQYIDTIYFAHLYPYNFSDLELLFNSLPVQPSLLCNSYGWMPIHAIFWDADLQKCVPVQSLIEQKSTLEIEEIRQFPEQVLDVVRKLKCKWIPTGKQFKQKPVVIIEGRSHSGEPNSSFAMEGLIKYLFSVEGKKLRQEFSWLLIPMLNVDGVVCGLYRTNLVGDDLNRVWLYPDLQHNPEVKFILDLISSLRSTRPIVFFLDFHGHSAAADVFTYGFRNEQNQDLYMTERIFPYLMSLENQDFNYQSCSFQKQPEYEKTMRVVLRRKFLILFSYTLEMSFSGNRSGKLFTPDDYRNVGVDVAKCIYELFFGNLSYYGRLEILGAFEEDEDEDDDHFLLS